MLPSTGYFKGINCPFYDSGLCERPYCHFRHVKKDFQSTNEEQSGAILQKLVSAAVQKVLQQTDVAGTVTSTSPSTVDITKASNIPVTQKATYNPTPISELNKIVNPEVETNEEANEQRKRHIPVPYTPRKPASLPIVRPFESNEESKPFVYNPPPIKYTPGSTELISPDPYLPKGSTESSNKYQPGTETETVLQEYTPKESLLQNSSTNKANYVPSDKNNSKKKILEYKPAKLSTKAVTPSLTYQPTPRSLVPCFSSDEDEPDTKKRKLSGDLNGLDELGAEFDMLDQILDEEKSTLDLQDSTLKNDKNKVLHLKDTKENKSIKCSSLKERTKSEKRESKKSYDKSKVDKNDTKSHKREKTESSTKSSHTKSSHKSSSKDKEKHKDIEKDKMNKNKSKHESKDKVSRKIENDKESSRISSKSKSSKSSNSKTESVLSNSTDKASKRSSSPSHHSKRKSDNSKSQRGSRDSKEKHKSSKKGKEISDNNYVSDDAVSEQNNEDLDEHKLSESDEADEDTIALECKRIFEAYVPQEINKVETDNAPKPDDLPEEEYVPGKKRISRTSDSNIKVVTRPALKPDYKKNAAQSMAERLAKVREYHASKISSVRETNVKMELSKSVLNSNNGSTKIRIAHVPYASTLLNAKKVIPPTKSLVNNPSTSSTIAQTLKKGEQRIAHMPSDKFIDRPGVLEPLASKIPANIRSTYLNMMIDECLKIYELPVDAYNRAQNEELNTSKKCSSVPIYKNSAVLAVNRLRKEIQECKGVKKSGIDISSNAQITPKSIDSGSWSIENKNRKVFDNLQFSGSKLYNNIKKWILTEKELQDNGFPRPHPDGEKGRAIIYEQRKQNPPKGYLRTCCRCKKEYTVDKKGFPTSKEECIYHPNNKYRVRGEARYQCCGQDGTSDGCCMAPNHVYEYVDYNNLKGYVRTLPSESTKDDYGVYSLDCEMCYTTHGLDLTRVTVINSACKVIYETLIKPLHPIIDYNTRYSGITEEQMAKVKTTLIEVQATLLTLFNSKTILIGHSLESDFKALKLIHDTVIDTSVLFPHKMGPPYKRALRNLCSEYLKKIIQNSVDGHDSAEDALVCMELIHFKLKEDLKTR